MTDDELADAGKAFMDALHARIDAEPAGPRRRRAERNAAIAHQALENIREMVCDCGMIQPMSGGGPKP